MGVPSFKSWCCWDLNPVSEVPTLLCKWLVRKCYQVGPYHVCTLNKIAFNLWTFANKCWYKPVYEVEKSSTYQQLTRSLKYSFTQTDYTNTNHKTVDQLWVQAMGKQGKAISINFSRHGNCNKRNIDTLHSLYVTYHLPLWMERIQMTSDNLHIPWRHPGAAIELRVHPSEFYPVQPNKEKYKTFKRKNDRRWKPTLKLSNCSCMHWKKFQFSLNSLKI